MRPALAASKEDLLGYQVLHDPTHAAVELIGPFGPGIAEALRQALNAHADVEWVHLTSPGGLVVEGRRVRDLIYARGLGTYVRTACVSACTLALIGGRQRVVRDGAVIGFHQYSRLTFESLKQRVQDEDRSYFAGRGVSPAFLGRMYDATHDEILELSAEEARREKIATRTTADFLAPPIETLPREMVADIGAALADFAEFIAVLDVYEPQMKYRLYVTIYDVVMSGQSFEDAVRFGEAVWTGLIERLLPETSNEAAHKWIRAFAAAVVELRSLSPRGCAATAVEGAVVDFSWTKLSNPTNLAIANALAAVVADAHRRPLSRPSEADRERSLADLGTAMVERFRPDDLDFLFDEESYDADPDRLCDLMIDYMELLADMPVEKGGRIIRSIYPLE